jgi:nucleotidyltransferase substrate binding protein (TIGR01987 family)
MSPRNAAARRLIPENISILRGYEVESSFARGAGGFLVEKVECRGTAAGNGTIMKDIRWKQRLENYKKALGKLSEAVEFVSDKNNLSNTAIINISKAGLIQCFEFTMELAWNVMKDYLTEDGVKHLNGSKDAIRNAFSYGLIDDGQLWIDMLGDRNLVSHTYNENVANNLANDIIYHYYPLFVKFGKKMEELI